MGNALSDYNIDFNTSMFRIMSRRAVDQLCRFRERNPSITGLVSIIGLPTTKVLVSSGRGLRHSDRDVIGSPPTMLGAAPPFPFTLRQPMRF
jgi:hypothetical protein